jgi:hypothetical protein
MPCAIHDNNSPLASGETAVSPAANVPTQTGTNENTTAPTQLAPSRDADEDESITPKAVTPAAPAIADPLGVAPEEANGHSNVSGQPNGVVNGATNELAKGRRGSADPLFVRRRAGTGVRDPPSSLSSCRGILAQLVVPPMMNHSRHLLFPMFHTPWCIR